MWSNLRRPTRQRPRAGEEVEGLAQTSDQPRRTQAAATPASPESLAMARAARFASSEGEAQTSGRRSTIPTLHLRRGGAHLHTLGHTAIARDTLQRLADACGVAMAHRADERSKPMEVPRARPRLPPTTPSGAPSMPSAASRCASATTPHCTAGVPDRVLRDFGALRGEPRTTSKPIRNAWRPLHRQPTGAQWEHGPTAPLPPQQCHNKVNNNRPRQSADKKGGRQRDPATEARKRRCPPHPLPDTMLYPSDALWDHLRKLAEHPGTLGRLMFPRRAHAALRRPSVASRKVASTAINVAASAREGSFFCSADEALPQ